MAVDSARSLTSEQRRQIAFTLIPASALVLAAFLAARFSSSPATEIFFDDIHWTIGYAVGALLAWYGVRWSTPKNRDARRWFAYALSACAAGQLAWDIQEASGWNPYPAPSDALFLCFGPCSVYAMLCTIRSHQAKPLSKALILDATTLAVAVLAIVVAVYLPRTESTGLKLAVMVVYPISMLTAACIAAVMLPTLKLLPTRRWLLFVVSSVINGILWMTWIYFSQDDTLAANEWIYFFFSAAAVAMGLGVSFWEVESSTDPVWERRCEGVLRMLPLLVVCGAAVSVGLAWSLPNVPRVVALAIYLCAAVVFVLAIVRQSLLLFERDRLLEMEKRTGELERTFQTLFRMTRSGLALLDSNGRFQKINPGCTELFGYAPAELLNTNIAKLANLHNSKLSGLLGLIDENGSGTIETEFLCKNGSLMQVELTSALIQDLDDQIFVILRNITKRKHAEQQLHLMAQRLSLATKSAGIGIWDFKPQSNTLVWDDRMHELYGIAPQDFYGRYEDWEQRVHPEDRIRLHAIYQSALAGRCEYHSDFRILKPDGQERHIETYAIIQLNADGKPERMIGVNWDITERRQSAENHARLEAQLRQSQKLEAIGTLASGIAHDFNNVLGAILGNIELALLDINPDSPALTSLQEIRKAGQRAKELVRRIVAFGRPQDHNAKAVQLKPVVEDAVKLVRATLPATVEINCKLDAQAPAVMIDSSQLSQVLLNLCANAFQAMEQQKGRIEITLDVQEFNGDAEQISLDLHAGRYVCLQVSDTGSGIDPAIIERIFEPFFTTKPVGEGSGLGLSIVHNIVRAHGGAITLESRLGAGATFHLYFPAATAEETAEAPATAPSVETGRGSSQHILYVDDEEPLVFLTKRLLERFGYRVSGFTDAAAALAAFQADSSSFDLVITDQSMPGTSGTDLAREVLRTKPEARIVLVSGYLRPREIELARAVGIQEVILKPDTIDELAAAVHRLLSLNTSAESVEQRTSSVN